jgi:hypothetical protein
LSGLAMKEDTAEWLSLTSDHYPTSVKTNLYNKDHCRFFLYVFFLLELTAIYGN